MRKETASSLCTAFAATNDLQNKPRNPAWKKEMEIVNLTTFQASFGDLNEAVI